MPRYVRRRAPYRRYRPAAPKKYGRKYGRRRFSKKRFTRNNVNQLTMRAPLASRLLRVKLPWVKTFSATVPTSGSSTYAFQGNGIIPYTAAGQSGANDRALPGDSLPAGETQYSQFYDKYFINGSSIKIEAVSTNAVTSSQPLVRAVLLALPFNNDDSDDNWQGVKTQLDAYTYEQLLAWPYAKWRMIGTNSGGASRLVFKMFRKTKNMCGLKDLRDNQQYGSILTDGRSTSDPVVNPYYGFMYYLRFFNSSNTNTSPLEITVRMSLYCTLTNREFNPIETITSPP